MSSDGVRSKSDQESKMGLNPDLHLSEYQNLEKTLRSMSEDQQAKCCPALFERAATSWWNPRFDSDILEGQYWRSTFPRTTRRFQLGLSYLLMLCLVWAIYFPTVATPHWYIFLSGSVSLGTVIFCMFLVTCSPIYSENCFKVSLLLCLLLCSLSLAVYLQISPSEIILENGAVLEPPTNISASTLGQTDLSEAGLFALYVEVLLLIYTVIPLPLYGTLLVGLSYTLLFEIIAGTRLPSRDFFTILIGILLHLSLHMIGCHILIMTQVRMRDTFMKVGQSLLVKRQLGMEKQLKEKMIHSVMPPKVSDWLMKGGVDDDEDDVDIDSETGSMMRKISSPRSSNQGDIRTIFRPFNMNAMENVSILFADIVGFTRMSSNKSASQLVGLLNDLFGRFDRMCIKCQCEKISTLGDCYYCVSGCPEPVEDHAANCVEMGLSMIRAIKDFDSDCNESVNMRVGIHTGTVLCGIVGKKRFKFDVWSNDVNLANRMESTGKPGMVHISDKTYQFLKEEYYVQQAEDFQNMKTYFITGRKCTSVYHLRVEANNSHPTTGHEQPYHNNKQTTEQNNHLNSINNNSTKEKVKLSESQPNGTKSLPVLGSEDSKEGRVIMNKLHRFLRQRSAPASGSPPPTISITKNDDDTQIKNSVTLKVPLLSKSEGSTPWREVTPQLSDKTCSTELDAGQSSQEGKKETFCTKDGRGAPCPLVCMDSEFEIVPGIKTPVSIAQSEQELKIGSCEESTELSGNYCNESSLAPLTDINNVYCNTSNTSVNTNDIALTFQEIENVNQGVNRGALTESLSRFHQLRKQSDLVLIRSVQEDTAHHRYFTKPPLHNISCFFLDSSIESEYRRTAWKANHSLSSEYDPEPTLASSSFNAYVDILVSGVVFLIVSLACFVKYGAGPIWVVVCAFAAIYHLLVVFVCVKHLLSPGPARSSFRKLYTWCRRWYPSQIFGAFLAAMPIISLLANLTCQNFSVLEDAARNFYLNLLTVTLIHFCNFTQIYCYVKSILASFFALSLIIFQALPSSCPCDDSLNNTFSNSSGFHPEIDRCLFVYNYFIGELILIITMLILLIWMLNREFEINYRLSYHCSLLAAKDRKKILNLKNQADWLLHNIIPNHVSDQLKKCAKYSENHKDVGIVFASLVNFNELYDESYMGGKEFLRVLNELISDFDELLDQSEFRNVEKIKTIGATFMAASGLNPFIREENHHKYQHIKELMEFAFSLQRSVEDFNQSLIEFDLVLRIGLNYGDITSGVIGTTKLYYDIWGDAVNIASRMDSTGVDGRIQVNERTKDVMKQWYDFEERGEIFVKGKDNMKAFLYNNKKESAMRMY